MIEAIESKVKRIVLENLSFNDLNLKEDDLYSETILKDIGLDSLEELSVWIDIEKEFNIVISDHIGENIKTVGGWINEVKNITIPYSKYL